MTECNQDTHVMTEALDHFVVKHKFCSIERILNQWAGGSIKFLIIINTKCKWT
jgi:hypothetical protein